MSYKIEQIEGIGPYFAERLGQVGVLTTDKLLTRCATPEGRRQLEFSTGIPSTQILTWTHRADLMRVSGIGSEFSELLESCGIESVKHLAMRDPENLVHLMSRVNDEKKLTRVVPALKTVTKWVERAKLLEPVLIH